MTEKAKILGKDPINSCLVGYDSNGVVEQQTHDGFIALGLSKREYFAGLAFSALIGTIKVDSICNNNDFNNCVSAIANNSVHFADALLEELSKED